MKKIEIKIEKAAWLYLRVSTEEQARDAYGLESQEHTCREFCQERGWAIEEIFTDRGLSAFHDVERPAFLRMMAALHKKPHVNLVFYDYSRFLPENPPRAKSIGAVGRARHIFNRCH